MFFLHRHPLLLNPQRFKSEGLRWFKGVDSRGAGLEGSCLTHLELSFSWKLIMENKSLASRVRVYPRGLKVMYIVVARKLEHHYPHALKVKYKGS